MMSAERLREAAGVLRQRAEVATPGPWRVPPQGDEYLRPTDVSTVGEPGERFVVCEHAGPDATYIATMSPPVALALADWLVGEAHLLDGQQQRPDLHTTPNMGRFAYMQAVADAILGAT